MKKSLIAAILLIIAPMVFAANYLRPRQGQIYPQPYVGIQAGWSYAAQYARSPHNCWCYSSWYWWGYGCSCDNTTNSQNGVGSRVYAGLKLLPFLGVETGFQYNTYGKLQSYAWDIMGRLSAQAGRMEPYVEFGGAYATAKYKSQNAHKWLPALGIGVLYYLNRNMSLGISWFSLIGSGRLDSRHSPIDVNKSFPSNMILALSLTYKFTNL